MKTIDRIFARSEPNVGQGDFVMRLVACIALSALVVAVLPPAGIGYRTIKIALLATAEVGIITFMLGLFLDTKTHVPGLQLFAAAMAMFWFVRRQLPWVAAVVGLLFLAAGIAALVTRRSRFNQIFNLSSIREVIENTP